MNSKLAFGAFFFALLILSSCSQMTSEQLQEKLISANTGLKSYSLDMTMQMDMSTAIQGQQMTITSDMTSKGDIDRVNKKLVLKGITRAAIVGMKTEMDMETYVIDDYLYAKTMNTWMKMKLSDDIWTEQDQISQMVALASSGSVILLEDETIDKNSYYVLQLNPDVKKIVELALKKEQQDDLLNDDMNFADMIRNYQSTIWVNKDTFVIEKSKTIMTIVMTPENMGKKNLTSGDIELNYTIDVKISNINKDVTIMLPPEAANAKDLTEIKNAAAQASPAGNSITGNAIANIYN